MRKARTPVERPDPALASPERAPVRHTAAGRPAPRLPLARAEGLTAEEHWREICRELTAQRVTDPGGAG